MSYALITNTGKESVDTNSVTTDAIDTSGADLVVANIGWGFFATQPTLSDSKTNTWSGLTAKQSTVAAAGRLYYFRGGTVGTGHTFTLTGSVDYPVIEVAAFSGSVASPLDDQSGNVSDAASSLQPGSKTPSEDNCLVVVGGCWDGNFKPLTGINGGFTITDNNPGTVVQAFGGALAYLIQTSAAAANPTLSGSGSGSITAELAIFKSASGGGGPSIVPIVDRQYRARWAA